MANPEQDKSATVINSALAEFNAKPIQTSYYAIGALAVVLPAIAAAAFYLSDKSGLALILLYISLFSIMPVAGFIASKLLIRIRRANSDKVPSINHLSFCIACATSLMYQVPLSFYFLAKQLGPLPADAATDRIVWPFLIVVIIQVVGFLVTTSALTKEFIRVIGSIDIIKSIAKDFSQQLKKDDKA